MRSSYCGDVSVSVVRARLKIVVALPNIPLLNDELTSTVTLTHIPRFIVLVPVFLLPVANDNIPHYLFSLVWKNNSNYNNRNSVKPYRCQHQLSFNEYRKLCYCLHWMTVMRSTNLFHKIYCGASSSH
uniref:Uncharacterized protein n=1 Tax=Glossina austeni TaxID=7395 RepID=A0A1A9UT53_GLOAU